MKWIVLLSFTVFFGCFSMRAGKEVLPRAPKNTIDEERKKEIEYRAYLDCFYEQLADGALPYEAFDRAIRGYFELKNKGKLKNERYLTIVDLSSSSNDERFFLIDMFNQRLVYKTLVAHGVNTGEEFATEFSNKDGSHKSSIGFYLTGETYNGKHDFSLKLDGLEFSNSKARERGIVIHAANYVSYEFIEGNGRLGRSYGCPALPHEDYFDIVSKIKDGACLFIYYPNEEYLKKSTLGRDVPYIGKY